MELDNELQGEGNSYGSYFRQYDPRIGRWSSMDPKFKLLPFESPYSFANNMPIVGNDPDGDVCVPCVIILLAMLTAPEVSMAPTNDFYGDQIAYQNAVNLKTQWILAGVSMGRLSMGGMTSRAIINDLKAQFYIQLAGNSVSEGIDFYNGEGFDIAEVLTNSAAGVDLFDAGISKFNINKKIGKLDLDKIKNVIASAAIDLSPTEINVLGLGSKNPEEFTVDLVFNAISEISDSKIAKTKINKIVKDIFGKIEKIGSSSANAEIKKQLGEKDYNEIMGEIQAIYDKSNPKLNTRKVNDNTGVRKRRINPKANKEQKRKIRAKKQEGPKTQTTINQG